MEKRFLHLTLVLRSDITFDELTPILDKASDWLRYAPGNVLL